MNRNSTTNPNQTLHPEYETDYFDDPVAQIVDMENYDHLSQEAATCAVLEANQCQPLASYTAAPGSQFASVKVWRYINCFPLKVFLAKCNVGTKEYYIYTSDISDLASLITPSNPSVVDLANYSNNKPETTQSKELFAYWVVICESFDDSTFRYHWAEDSSGNTRIQFDSFEKARLWIDSTATRPYNLEPGELSRPQYCIVPAIDNRPQKFKDRIIATSNGQYVDLTQEECQLPWKGSGYYLAVISDGLISSLFPISLAFLDNTVTLGLKEEIVAWMGTHRKFWSGFLHSKDSGRNQFKISEQLTSERIDSMIAMFMDLWACD